jgi:preprotein translocase subunit SecY
MTKGGFGAHILENKLVPKLALLVFLLATVVMCMAFTLIVFKVEQTQRNLRISQYSLLASELERQIKRGLELGITLSEMTTLPSVMKRWLATDDAMLAIEMSDEAGLLLYAVTANSTSYSPVVALVPSWFAVAKRTTAAHADNLRINPSQQALWHWQAGEDAASGIAVNSAFGEVVGYVAIRYSTNSLAHASRHLALALLPAATAVYIALSITLMVIFTLAAHRFECDVHDAALQLLDGTANVSGVSHHRIWRDNIAILRASLSSASAALASWHSKYAAKTAHRASSSYDDLA